MNLDDWDFEPSLTANFHWYGFSHKIIRAANGYVEIWQCGLFQIRRWIIFEE